jgi:hypothetical protein
MCSQLALFPWIAIFISLLIVETSDLSYGEPTTQRLTRESFAVARDGGPLVLPVYVAGRRYSFLLDTGSSITAVDRSLRDILAQPLRAEVISTLYGERRVTSYRAPVIRIGGYVASEIPEVACVDLSGARAVGGCDVRGILGMDFLKRQILKLDFDKGEVRFLASVPEGSGTSFSLLFEEDRPRVPITIEGAGERLFILDTGDVGISFGSIEPRFLTQLIDAGRAVTIGASLGMSFVDGRSAQCSVARVAGISIGGLRHSNVVFDSAADNTLGLGFLARYVVTLDFPSRTIYLKPGARVDEPSRHDLSGAHLLWQAEATTVARIDEGSAADRCGLKSGDILLEMDGRETSSMSMTETRQLLSIVGKHRLVVFRMRQRIQIVLELSEAPSGTTNERTPRR